MATSVVIINTTYILLTWEKYLCDHILMSSEGNAEISAEQMSGVSESPPQVDSNSQRRNPLDEERQRRTSGREFLNKHPLLSRIVLTAAGGALALGGAYGTEKAIKGIENANEEQRIETLIDGAVQRQADRIVDLYDENSGNNGESGIITTTETRGWEGVGERLVGNDVIIPGPEDPQGGVGSYDLHTTRNSVTGEITALRVSGSIDDQPLQDPNNLHNGTVEDKTYLALEQDSDGDWRFAIASNGEAFGGNNFFALDSAGLASGIYGNPDQVVENIEENIGNLITSAEQSKPVSEAFSS